MAVDINYLREKLENDEKRLTEELSSFAKKVSAPGQVENWEAVPDKDETDIEFNDEQADASEELEERHAAEEALEDELERVKKALARIASDTYGHCSVCGMTIEDARLNAEPTADTCIEHKNHQ